MEAFLVSTGLVALAEIGDKTQLLAFLLAARFRRPLPICLGILIATVVNHACAGALGTWITTQLSPQVLRWGLGLGFVAMAIWTLIPDKLDEEEEGGGKLKLGVLGTTIVAFLPQWQMVRTSRISSAQASRAAEPGKRLPWKSTRNP